MLSDSLLSNSKQSQQKKQLRPKQNPWPASQWSQWISAWSSDLIRPTVSGQIEVYMSKEIVTRKTCSSVYQCYAAYTARQSCFQSWSDILSAWLLQPPFVLHEYQINNRMVQSRFCTEAVISHASIFLLNFHEVALNPPHIFPDEIEINWIQWKICQQSLPYSN